MCWDNAPCVKKYRMKESKILQKVQIFKFANAVILSAAILKILGNIRRVELKCISNFQTSSWFFSNFAIERIIRLQGARWGIDARNIYHHYTRDTKWWIKIFIIKILSTSTFGIMYTKPAQKIPVLSFHGIESLQIFANDSTRYILCTLVENRYKAAIQT